MMISFCLIAMHPALPLVPTTFVDISPRRALADTLRQRLCQLHKAQPVHGTMSGHTGPQSRRSLQLKVLLAICAVLAAAWLLQAVVDWRSAVLPLLGLQPLHGRTHHAQNRCSQHILLASCVSVQRNGPMVVCASHMP